MISQLKQLIIANSSSFDFPIIRQEELFISKFYPTQALGRSKVLFLFSYMGKLRGILKMIRVKDFDHLLEKEMQGQETQRNAIFKTPRTLFKGELSGHTIYAEEFIAGEILSKNQAAQTISKVYEYQASLTKQKEINVRGIITKFASLCLEDSEFKALLSELKSELKTRDKFYTAKQHGDLTRMNIIKGKDKQLYLIDWENFGDKPVWGMDFCHFFVRALGIRKVSEFKKQLEQFSKSNNLSLDPDYFATIWLFDRAYDYVQKKWPQKYVDLTSK